MPAHATISISPWVSFNDDVVDQSSATLGLVGSALRGDDLITTGSGPDDVRGSAGDDTLIGSAGDDTLTGGDGADSLLGGLGVDRLGGGSGADWLDGRAGSDLLRGAAGDDVLVFRPGLDGDDTLRGGFGDDTLLLSLTAAQAADPTILAEIERLRALLEAAPDGSLNVRSTVLGFRAVGVERIEVTVDGATSPVDLRDVAAGAGGLKISGAASYNIAGTVVSGGGDVNGDGFDDLAVGAWTGRGNAYVVFGSSAALPIDLSDVAQGTGGFRIVSESRTDALQGAISIVGDVNGDGFADLLVGAGENDSGGETNNGAAYVVFGKADGRSVSLASVAEGAGGFKILGTGNNGQAGRNVAAAGDINGDGLADLLVGGPIVNGGAGVTYVVFGKSSGSQIDLDDVVAGVGGFEITGGNRLEFFSEAAGVGDINGDGLGDIVVGSAGGPSSPKTAYLVFGRTETSAIDLRDVESAGTGFSISITGPGGGIAAGAAGDVNGDGTPDISVAQSSAGAGLGYVVFGRPGNAPVNLVDVAAGNGGFQIRGETVGDVAGAIRPLGDLNGDGLGDLLVGAFGATSSGRAANGAVYVVFGKTDGSSVELSAVAAGIGGFKIIGEAAGDSAGIAFDGVGDFNGDGAPDVAIGAIGNDSNGLTNNGAAYIVYGEIA